MRVNRPLFTCLALFFIFSNIAFSQSSLFQDAKELANYLEQDWTYYVKLKKTNSSKATLSVMQGKTELKSSLPNSNIFTLSEYGYYSIDAKDFESTDSIFIIYRDTIYEKFSASTHIGFDNTPEGRDFTLYSNASIEPDTFFVVVDTIWTEKMLIDSLTGDSIITMTADFVEAESYLSSGPALFFTMPEKNNDELNAAYNVLFNLGAHSEFKEVDNSPKINFKKIQGEYATNPFLNNIVIRNPLMSPNVDAFLPYEFSDSINNNFTSQFYKGYPWHKLLYGDSVLNFQKMVSFKDASISYRKQITTSQNELSNASVRINQTSRNKGFLDAKTVAVGLSDFIAERAQEELNLTFFNRFKENLDRPSELTVLFPNTKNLLYQFEISNYKTLLSHARESFKVDLDNLGLNFPEILKLNKYKKLYNSPEVFNLSLIYSIADLAYKEEPVENILIASFQKLQERKAELKKSINIELADNFITSVKPQGIKKYKITSQDVNRNGDIQTMKKYVEEYLTAVENAENALRSNKHDLGGLYNSSINKFQSKDKSKENLYEKMYDRIEEKEINVDKIFERPIQYNNRVIGENSILDFYQKTITTNLSGKAYYGYMMDNPYPDDYKLYFKPPPDSINSIIAEGIESSRNLMDENFEEILEEYYLFLQTAAVNHRNILKNDILEKEAAFGPEKKISNFMDQVNLLKAAIDQEILFWKKITQQDETDHHIAGLYFLKALIERNDQINLFFWVSQELQSGIEYPKLVKDFYPKTLGKNFTKNMQLASNQLDSIQTDFEDKVKSLVNEYGQLNFQDSLYQHQLLNAEFTTDSTKIDDELNKKSRTYNEQMNFIIDASEFSASHLMTEIEYYEKSAPKLAAAAKKILELQQKDSSLKEQLTALNKQLENITDAAQKENINNQIKQLNQERNLVEQKTEVIINDNVNQIADLRKIELEKLAPKKEAMLEKYQAKRDSLKNTNFATAGSLRQFYSLKNNSFLKQYTEAKENINVIDFYERKEMEGINELDNELKKTNTILTDLKSKRAQLNNFFTQLDTTYCKDLVDAQQNANNLAKSLEFSTHLLFAFRDYERIYDPLFIYDSSYLKVTLNQLDTLTGFTNTITSDSLVIKKDTLEGTTEPMIAARWITRKEFNDLRKNELQWNIFLGLLYQRLNTIEDAPNFSAQGVALLATKFLSITHDMDTYRTDLRIKKATKPDLVTFKDYYPFIRSTVDLFNTVITTPSIGDSTATVSRKFGLQNIPQISNEALSLYENIYIKEYGNAVLNAMELLKIIANKKLGKKEARKSQRSINAVLTYGTFMANMINAQTSDQVKNILRSATLPPGSSRIKRETVSSFTINSYLGVAAGRDRLLGVPDNLNLKQDAFGASLSVPIGFTYSFSPNLIKNNSSFSIHVPLIDLGAITAYRQNPDNPNYSIDDLPDFSWENLFSPGAFVVYNFSNSPFSLGVGGQYGPQLRQITPTGGEAINVNSWRFPMAFFTIDVPFFNLHTGARKIIVD